MRRCNLRHVRAGMFLVALVAAVAAVPASFAQAAQVTLSHEEFALIEAINAYRVSQGLRALKPQAQMIQAAQTHSSNMAQTGIFDHSTAPGDSLEKRVYAAGITWFNRLGETCSVRANAQEVVNGWRNSEHHNRIMLTDEYTHIGASLVQTADGRKYWTATYAKGLEGTQGEVVLPNGTRVSDNAAPAPDADQGNNGGTVINNQPNTMARLQVWNTTSENVEVYMVEGSGTRLLGTVAAGTGNYGDYAVGTRFLILKQSQQSGQPFTLEASREVTINP